jgi:hypothetical protein
MPVLASTAHADRTAILGNVRDHNDLRAARHAPAFAENVEFDLAEAAGEGDLPGWRDMLLAEEDDPILVIRPLDRGERGVVERLGQIDAADLRAERGRACFGCSRCDDFRKLDRGPELAFLSAALLPVRFGLDVILIFGALFGQKAGDPAPRRNADDKVGSRREHQILAETEFVDHRSAAEAHEVLQVESCGRLSDARRLLDARATLNSAEIWIFIGGMPRLVRQTRTKR